MKIWQGLSLFLGLLTACVSTNNIPTVSEEAVPADNQPVVLSSHVQLIQTTPIAAQLHVKLQWRDRCEHLEHISQTQEGSVFQLKIFSNWGEQTCTPEPRVSEYAIPLEVQGLNAGVYTVMVNGVAASFELNLDYYAGGSLS